MKKANFAAAAPIDLLYVAPENARTQGSESANHIAELAANIEAFGLLQPLVAYADDAGRFAVADGGRRYAALKQLADRNVSSNLLDFTAIPLKLIPQEQAHAASLAANTQRVDLGIVEAAEAWSQMALKGMDTPEIARVFGVTERFVDSRLALAGLFTPILEALRKGEISLDVAQAYAGAKMARQEQVWKQLGGAPSAKKGGDHRDWEVRRELKKDTLIASDALAKFVGEAAYVAAGGVVERELFQADADSRWLQPDLARALADKKLAETKSALEAEGFLFVEAAHSFAHGAYVDGNLGKARKPSAEEKERMGAIAKELKSLRKQMEKNEQADAYDYELEEKLSDQKDALTAEHERIEAALITFEDAAKQKSGVLVSIDEQGGLQIQRGMVAPKERKTVKPGQGAKASAGKAASTSPAKPEPQAPMTNLTHERTSRIASVIVGRAIAAKPGIAIIAITATLARQTLLNTMQAEALCIAGGGEGADPRTDLLTDKANDAEEKRWQVALGVGVSAEARTAGKKAPAALEETLATWPRDDVLRLLAYCVGQSVSVIETNAARTYGKQEARARLIALGRLAGALPAAHFIPDADYLNGCSRETLAEAAAELKLDAKTAKTKSALAAMIAAKAKESAWTPPLLRTLCGMEAKPAKAEAPAAKRKETAPKSTKRPVAKAPAKKPAKKLAKPKAKPVAEARA